MNSFKSGFILLFLAHQSFSASGKLQTCSVSLDTCPEYYTCDQGYCVREFEWPPSTRDIVGSVILFFVAGIANAGGLAGGFILVPILILVNGFTTRTAVKFAYCLSFGGLTGAFIIKAWLRDPYTRLPAIRYDIAIICAPIVILGANMGVLLNRVLPSVVTLVLLIYFQIMAAIRLWRRVKTRWGLFKQPAQPQPPEKKENEREAQQTGEQRPEPVNNNPPEPDNPCDEIAIDINAEYNRKPPQPEDPRIPPQEQPHDQAASKKDKKSSKKDRFKASPDSPRALKFAANEPNFAEYISNHGEQGEKVFKLYTTERIMFPWKRYLELALLVGLFILLQLLRGSGRFKSIIGIRGCSAVFWVVYFMVIPLTAIFFLIGRYILLRIFRQKEEVNYPFKAKSDITPKLIHKYRNASFKASFRASLIGASGAKNLINIFVAEGVHGLSASATAGFIGIFSSFTAVILVYIGNDLPKSGMAYFILLSFTASLCFTIPLTYLSKKYVRAPITATTLFVITVVGVGILLVHGITRFINEPKLFTKFGDICPVEDITVE